ncbi:hypothetical protein [Methanolobus psychrotolerans]|uniref:hypothetical protein n=1 Tax=Methanolobus psychrotolerans TaxID=1874706 RepID=UPI00101AE373|nr:hypothetical protein [Methanolobus psychrotolerans]
MIHKNGLSNHCAGQIKTCLILLCATIIVILTMTSAALAEVTEMTISPENPSPGDTVTITGKASPNEEISASVSFAKIQAVSDGVYEYHIGKVTIPEGSDSFGLKAVGVNNLDVTVYILGVPITVPASVSNNIATFGTSKIKSGTYDLKLSGIAPGDEVTLSFNAKATITADADGNFAYSYTTENMPEGDFSVKIGGQSRQLSLGTMDDNDDSSSSSPSGKSSSSHTGTELNIVPADTLGDEESDGVGEDAEASTIDGASESLGSTAESNDISGYVLENQTSGIKSKLPDLGVMGAVLGVFCLGAIFIGFRKNQYK